MSIFRQESTRGKEYARAQEHFECRGSAWISKSIRNSLSYKHFDLAKGFDLAAGEVISTIACPSSAPGTREHYASDVVGAKQIAPANVVRRGAML